MPIGRLARYFEFWLLRLQGVYPPVTACSRCGGDLSAGGRLEAGGGTLVCVQCAPPDEGGGLSAAAMAFLAAARAVAPLEPGSVELSAAADRELTRAHQRLIRTHLDKELKSLRVVQSLTSGSRGG